MTDPRACPVRLTEEEVSNRLWDAFCEPNPPQFLVDWTQCAANSPHHLHPAALAAVGVRWTGQHYEEVGDG